MRTLRRSATAGRAASGATVAWAAAIEVAVGVKGSRGS